MSSLLRSTLLLLILHTEIVAAAISLSVTPQVFPCGEAILVSYSYTGSETLPLTLFLKGQLSLVSSASIVLPNPPARSAVVDFSWAPSGCESPGSWFFFIQDGAYFATSSNNAPVSIKAVG